MSYVLHCFCHDQKWRENENFAIFGKNHLAIRIYFPRGLLVPPPPPRPEGAPRPLEAPKDPDNEQKSNMYNTVLPMKSHYFIA